MNDDAPPCVLSLMTHGVHSHSCGARIGHSSSQCTHWWLQASQQGLDPVPPPAATAAAAMSSRSRRRGSGEPSLHLYPRRCRVRELGSALLVFIPHVAEDCGHILRLVAVCTQSDTSQLWKEYADWEKAVTGRAPTKKLQDARTEVTPERLIVDVIGDVICSDHV